jgi:hypothetical protein
VSGQDDKYITYWSAHALADVGALVNYNGDRVEQSSSLTHVALLAALAKPQWLSLSTLGWLFSVVCGVSTVVWTFRIAASIAPALAQTAALFAASSVGLVSFGGLETALVSLLGLATVAVAADIVTGGLTPRRWLVAVVVAMLFVGARPEAGFVALAAWLGLLLVAWARRFTAVGDPTDPEGDAAVMRRSAMLLAESGPSTWAGSRAGNVSALPIAIARARPALRSGIFSCSKLPTGGRRRTGFPRMSSTTTNSTEVRTPAAGSAPKPMATSSSSTRRASLRTARRFCRAGARRTTCIAVRKELLPAGETMAREVVIDP